MRIKDTEVVGITAKGSPQNIQIISGTGLLRLENVFKMYDRFRVLRMTLIWRPACPTTTTGVVAIGFVPSVVATVTKNEDILRLKPSLSGTAYTQHSLTITAKDIMKSAWCLSSEIAGAFWITAPDKAGVFTMEYDIILDVPKPF